MNEKNKTNGDSKMKTESISERAHNIAHDSRLKNIEWDAKYSYAYEVIAMNQNESDEQIIAEILS